MKTTVLLLLLSHVSLSLQTCLKPALPRYAESVNQLKNAYNENEKFYYQCVEGYHFQNDDEIQHKVLCKNGAWQPSFLKCVDNCDNKCVHGSCIAKINRNTNSTQYGCLCEESYTQKYCDIRICSSLGTLPHGKIIPERYSTGPLSRAVGTRVRFTCDVGYIMDGYPISTCRTTGWSHHLPTCKVLTCKIPDNIDKKLYYIPMYRSYPIHKNIRFSCMDSYVLHGVVSVYCTSKGVWSGEWPICSRPFCPTPPQISHGYRRTDIKYPIGGIVTYTCESGYVMDPTKSSQRKCSPALMWTGELPKCLRLSEFRGKCERSGQMMVKSDGRYQCARVNVTPVTAKNSSTKTLTIVTATAGGLLLLLLIVISIVALQRRRVLRNRNFGRSDDRCSFVYYSNDVHVVLPSYDEAMQARTLQAPPPYRGGDNQTTAAPLTARRHALNALEAAQRGENEYETIDDLTTATENTPPQTSEGEPIYASIQRVLGGNPQNVSPDENNGTENEINRSTEEESASPSDDVDCNDDQSDAMVDDSDRAPLISN
ncbi:sushi, von Willebrand factor type A, EGF and pentraxin domain-containing protein 1-like [Hydractinia symbiolongicarpus]|uniref:sushi, von Willebrand factor type A, EGF and pentraxin domain-containing protein 1-like n=1 Tax=Hydractinia symbiolongicarpus TaxID=13093 RepID=UPI00254C1DD9|nr:sushi, von Willebrand factor type A, EGF and pentraxin domain-containing protein 1-like [Hydractinia symbiolongicarpus]